MNIRNRVIETYIPGYYITTQVNVPYGWFGGRTWEEKKIYVPSRDEKKTVMEYLNPETTKWEPIPEKHESIYIDRPTN